MDREDKQRFKVLDMVNQNYLTLREATELLHLSYRQIRRMYRRFREQGECALAHGLKGKPSNRRIDTGIREKILSFYEENYSDTSLAFFMKKLACLGYEVNRETLRRWLIAEGFWRGRHKPDISYPKNGKKTNFGELLWLTRKEHAWLGEEFGNCCLFSIIDDATGITLSSLYASETIKAAMNTLCMWVKKYGIPMGICCEKRLVYGMNDDFHSNNQEVLAMPRTAFYQACARLGVDVIVATPLQIEKHLRRTHDVYCDKLIKKLRSADVHTLEMANTLLGNGFLNDFSRQAADAPSGSCDYHVKLIQENDLNNIFCYTCTTTVSPRRSICYKQKYFYLTGTSTALPAPGTQVTIREWLDGSIHVYYNRKELRVVEVGGKIDRKIKYIKKLISF